MTSSPGREAWRGAGWFPAGVRTPITCSTWGGQAFGSSYNSG
ncbi:hypothetical protein [Pseudomonas chlororaphis]|nr:hypothetical protein [Pseudomonas chlororaphis]AZC38806.1 hypothetical protein C4K37_4428 [Pseudomonas chlororaphis subsp. piscium]AZC45356.1 hypothetical protein C4K36_4440 [Pseudomonas chlororaphis subsp. piscium]AZC83352.1 hypothetical protein C4K30_4247 [Pseudomonas chlororaphis subsp. piscium]WDG70920.1 hypothetical protein PUP65_22760 [Pseudomonas chlororaphis]WDH31294.1 hypothetical protein PUP81_11560 [Pseudomonas chlororaphis]